MGKDIEIIDGVKGEWLTVTKPEEVKVGQRVRYFGCKVGFNGENRFVEKIAGHFVSTWNGKDEKNCCGDLLYFQDAQAFFPIAKKNPRKVAKVDVGYFRNGWQWAFVSFELVEIHTTCNYSTRAHAIRGARRFCKSIGYECEIVG